MLSRGRRKGLWTQKWAKREGFVAFPKTMAGVGHLKRICKDAFSVAGAVQETCCSSEMLGGPALISWEWLHFGASDLQVCWDDFAWQVQHFIWQHQKRINSARLPQLLHLTTSKTKQFCETPWIFELDNIKNEAIRRDFLQKWKVECRADGLVPLRFVIFRLHLSKLLRLPRKSHTRSKSRRIASFSSLQIDR